MSRRTARRQCSECGDPYVAYADVRQKHPRCPGCAEIRLMAKDTAAAEAAARDDAAADPGSALPGFQVRRHP